MINSSDHMKFTKKILVSSLALLIASSLGACGGDGGGGESTPSANSSSTNIPSTASTNVTTNNQGFPNAKLVIHGPSITNIPNDNTNADFKPLVCPENNIIRGNRFIKKNGGSEQGSNQVEMCIVVTSQAKELGKPLANLNYNPNYYGNSNRLLPPNTVYSNFSDDQIATLRANSFRTFLGNSTTTSRKYTSAGNFVAMFTLGFNNAFTGYGLVPSKQFPLVETTENQKQLNIQPQFQSRFILDKIEPEINHESSFTGKNVRVGVVDGNLDLNDPNVFKLFGHTPIITNAVKQLEPSQENTGFLAPTENHALSVSAIIGGSRSVLAPKPPLLKNADNQEIPMIVEPPAVSVSDGNDSGSISASPSGDEGAKPPSPDSNPKAPANPPKKPVEIVKLHIGLAPGVQLYISRIWGSLLHIGKIYPYMVNTYHPAVINNSIFFSPSNSRTAAAHNLRISPRTLPLAKSQEDQLSNTPGKLIKNFGFQVDPGLVTQAAQHFTAKNLTTKNLQDLHEQVLNKPLIQLDYKLLKNSVVNPQNNKLVTPDSQVGLALQPRTNQLAPPVINAATLKTASTDSDESVFASPKSTPAILTINNPNGVTTSSGNRLDSNCSVNNDNSALSFICGINNAVNKPHAPLLVFAAGNYDDVAFNQKLDKLSDRDLINSIANKNWGLAIPDESILRYILYGADSKARDNSLVVSGEFYDFDHSIESKAYKIKLDKIIGRLGVDVANGIQAQFPQPTVDKNKFSFEYNQESYNNYISAYGSYQCGVTAYDCITASFKYEFPSTLLAKNAQDYFVSGTSVSTPIVSAVAALVKEQFPWFSAKNLKTTILTTAIDAGVPGVDPVFGWGVINAAAALKGPGAFAFGNFYADMTGSLSAGYQEDSNAPFTPSINNIYKYYFANDIVGAGGLVVSGLPTQYLYLLGHNTYTGDTIVNSGNLVITSPSSITDNKIPGYTGNNNQKDQFTTSKIYVNSQARLYANLAELGSVRNNGTVLFNGVTVNNFIQEPNANLVINIDKIQQPTVVVKGKAYLSGNLVFNNDTFDPKNISMFKPVGSEDEKQSLIIPFFYTESFLNDKNSSTKSSNNEIIGTFNNVITTNATPLQSYTLFYDLAKQFIALQTELIPINKVSNALQANSEKLDSNLLNDGSARIQKLYDKQAAQNSTHKPTTSKGESLVSLAAGEASLEPNNTQPSSESASKPAKSSPTPLVTALGYIQNLNIAQLKTFLFNAAGTVYSSSQGALTQQALLANQRFADKTALFADPSASPNYANSELEFAKPLFKVYANYNYANHDWKHKLNRSQVEGKQISNSTEFGVYGQYLGFNYGIGAVHTTHKWHELLTPDVKDLTPSQAAKLFNNPNLDNEAITGVHNLALTTTQTLGTADVDSYGFSLSGGIAREDYYLQATGFANFNKFTLHRSSLFNLDQLANFKTNILGITLGGGYKLPIQAYLGSNSDLIVKAGITAYNYHQDKFSETVDPQASVTTNNPSNTQVTSKPLSKLQSLASSVLSFDAKQHNSFGSLANLGAMYSYNFTILGTHMKVTAQADLQIGLATPKFVLDLTDNSSTSNTFENNFLANFALGYNVKITNDLEFSARGSYQTGENWSLKQVDLGLTYKF